MHIRVTTTRRKDKTYRYAQLVQSYRRDDGMPAHRVLASLGRLSDLEVENLRQALAASRDGVEVVQLAAKRPHPVVRANLRYLDVAVVLRAWEDLGLGRLLRTSFGRVGAEVPDADVIAALAVHRCVAPGSKLAAQRWYPTTALPLLQGMAAGAFNNTRVHRALDGLAAAEADIQEALPTLARPADGSFVALFLDATDTWFEGRGPPMAEKGRDKEGIYRRRVGLALLCDPRGYPVRWKTLPGRYREAPVFEEICTQLAGLPWVGTAPVVMDRAMGRAGNVEFLADSGLRFLTALAVDEFSSYTAQIPQTSLVAGETTSEMEAWARSAGFERVDHRRHVLDLGVIEKGDGVVEKGRRHRGTSQVSMTAAAMARAHLLQAERDAGATSTEMAQRHGTSRAYLAGELRLLELLPALQKRVLAGELGAALLKELQHLAALPKKKQREAFEQLRSATAGKKPRNAHRRHQPAGPPPLRVRMVLQFNPERLLEQRQVALAQLDEVYTLAASITAHLSQPRIRRTVRAVRREMDALLARKKLLDCVAVEVEDRGDGSAVSVHVRLDDEAWSKRHRHDGITVLVADPRIGLSAAELVDLYFAKDAVERDFHVIKSELELRPVRHRTDVKVHAHVALCVLALLTERAIEERLRTGGLPCSAPAALDELATCHLNELKLGKAVSHQLTELTSSQRQLLAALAMDDLAEPHQAWTAADS